MASADASISFAELDLIKQMTTIFNFDDDEIDKVNKISTDMFKMVLDYRANKIGVPEIIDKLTEVPGGAS